MWQRRHSIPSKFHINSWERTESTARAKELELGEAMAKENFLTPLQGGPIILYSARNEVAKNQDIMH